MTILDKFRTQTLAAELRITEERAKDLQTNEHEVIRISELERLLKYTPFGGKKSPYQRIARAPRLTVSNFRLPDEIHQLRIEFLNFEKINLSEGNPGVSGKVKLHYRRRSRTFTMNSPKDFTAKGVLEDLFRFADYCLPGKAPRNSEYDGGYLMRKSSDDRRLLRLLFNDTNTGGWDLRGRREILLEENDGIEIHQRGRRTKNLTGEWRPSPKSRAVGNCIEDRKYIAYASGEDEHNYMPEDTEKYEFRYFRNLALFETRPYEEIYTLLPEIVCQLPKRIESPQPSRYTSEKYESNIGDFINYIFTVDRRFYSEVNKISGLLEYKTRYGELIGVERADGNYIVLFDEVKPLERPIIRVDYSPIFADDIVSSTPITKLSGNIVDKTFLKLPLAEYNQRACLEKDILRSRHDVRLQK